MERNIGNFILKGTSRELAEMQDIIDNDGFDYPNVHKYFYTWVSGGTGLYMFPRCEYFVDYSGDRNYAVALLHYGASNADLVYEY